MLIEKIPYHLRNSIVSLELPLYIELTEDVCRPPDELALGDALMVLGLIRNQAKPVRLYFNPGAARELVEAHPLVKELLSPEKRPAGWELTAIPVGRSGRGQTWVSKMTHSYRVPVLPVDQIKANPVYAHSLYYGLRNVDDRASVFVDPARRPALKGFLSAKKPTIVVFPLNPGRGDFFWQDEAWWIALLRELGKDYHLVAVGAKDYGELTPEVDEVLAMDHPDSTLADLAWLMQNAHGFIGRDGGLAHLALAVNSRVTVVWDSMVSYRFWASHQACHIVMSNPYAMRYPQACRLFPEDLAENTHMVSLPGPEGRIREEKLNLKKDEARVIDLFGSVSGFARAVQAQREILAERQAVESWIKDPAKKREFYTQSLGVALAALKGRLEPGQGWVAPVLP